MKRLLANPAALLGALMVLGAGTARADFNSNWGYSLSLDSGPTFNSASNNSNVSFALNADGATGVQTIPVGNLSSNSSSTTLDPVGASYHLTVGITDGASGKEHDFTWQGTISGSVSSPTTDSSGNQIAGQSTLHNVFGGPLSEQALLGGNIYTVTIQPGATAINAPKQSSVPVSATVTVAAESSGNQPGGNNPPPGGGVSSTPEPSSLLLAGCAASLLGLSRWRRGRAAVAPAGAPV
jgi:hypothetical protein